MWLKYRMQHTLSDSFRNGSKTTMSLPLIKDWKCYHRGNIEENKKRFSKKFPPEPRKPKMPHKRKNAKAARSAPEGFSLAFLQQCGMGNKARSEEISFGGRKKILKFLSDLIGATPGPHQTLCFQSLHFLLLTKAMFAFPNDHLEQNRNNANFLEPVHTISSYLSLIQFRQ